MEKKLQQDEIRPMIIPDYELVIEALTKNKEVLIEKRNEAVELDRWAVERRCKTAISRTEMIIEACKVEMRLIRRERFEKKKNSRKWIVAVLKNSNKLCK